MHVQYVWTVDPIQYNTVHIHTCSCICTVQCIVVDIVLEGFADVDVEVSDVALKFLRIHSEETVEHYTLISLLCTVCTDRRDLSRKFPSISILST